MEKISQIVRSSARVGSVDMKNAAPVRSGVPSFGRPVADTAITGSKLGSTAARAAALSEQISENRKTNAHDQIVRQMADQFFVSRNQPPPESDVNAPVDTTPVSEPSDGSGELVKAAAADSGEEVSAPPPSSYTPRGTYIDVVA